jgi:hypothetical protein
MTQKADTKPDAAPYYWLAQQAAGKPGPIEEFYDAFRRDAHAKSALFAFRQAVQLKPGFAPAFGWLVEYTVAVPEPPHRC